MPDEFLGVERPDLKLPGRRDNFAHGVLRVIDLALVKRLWMETPVEALLAKLKDGSLPISAENADALKGLDYAISSLTLPALSGKPLAENLRARRALGIPWKWLNPPPDARTVTRVDERLVRLAEHARLEDVSASDVLAVTSLARREMVGSKEVRAAFESWGDPSFAAAIENVADAEIIAIVDDAWGGPAPLMAAIGVDDESELATEVAKRLARVRAMVRLAREKSAALVPWTKENADTWLAMRAAAR